MNKNILTFENALEIFNDIIDTGETHCEAYEEVVDDLERYTDITQEEYEEIYDEDLNNVSTRHIKPCSYKNMRLLEEFLEKYARIEKDKKDKKMKDEIKEELRKDGWVFKKK